jgi:tubby-related protein 1
MGECPRYFGIEINQDSNVHKLENLKPEFNNDMDCYCLNFYGRVKKASAKNFQIIYPGDPDNIILQHGKVNRDEFNIDFREPFNFVNAFAVSLVSIGKKRVVS